jgi:bacteriocin biosynthesis cyclodehydratase domain-containing protein
MLELNPAVTYASVSSDRIVFFTPTGRFTILDKAGFVGRVLHCLSERQPIDEAFAQIPDDTDRAHIREGVIGALRTRRVIQETPSPQARGERGDLLCAWLRYAGGQTGEIGPVGVVGTGTLAELMLEELERLGLAAYAVDHVDSELALVVLCQSQENMTQLRAINRQSVQLEVPFFPIVTDRHIVSLGPVIIPGATACIECAYHRQRMNAAEKMLPVGQVSQLHTSFLVARLGATLGTIEVARFLMGAIYDLDIATCVRHSALTGKQSHAVILKLPRCPVCGIGRGDRPLVDTFITTETALLEPAE